MIGKLKIIILGLVLLPILSFATAFADPNNPLNDACQTNDLTRASAVCQQSQNQGTTNPIAGPGGIINTAADVIALVAGVAAVIMIILGGFAYVTAAGNTDAVTKARQRIIGALVGLVVIALAWTIITYVSDNLIK